MILMNGLILCTQECNLRCTYCFEESMHSGCMPTLSEIRNRFDKFLDNGFEKFVIELININEELGRETDITFHGGEPMLIGVDLLRKAFEIVKQYEGTTISMQSNGTLITDEMVSLLKEFNVRVGISIDGPKEMHDQYRLNIGKKGSFDLVFENIKKLKAAGVVVGGLATVTDQTLKHPEKFYRFFKDNKLDYSFNPLFIEPNKSSDHNVLNVNDYITFYKKMFDLWINDNDGYQSIQCFERIMSAMGVKRTIFMEVCTYIPDCSKTTVAIDTNGDFYRCLHYCMDKKNRIGNINEDNLKIAVGDEQFSKRFDYLKETLCKDCDIQDYCCGGCPYVAESNNGTIMSKSSTCQSQYAIVHYIYDYMQGFLKNNGNA